MAVKLEEICRKLFPHGHPDFIPTTLAEMQLHSDKNFDYAAGGDPLGNFERVSQIKKLYPDFDWASPVGVAIGYALKQVDAALWMMGQGNEGKVEGVEARFGDVSVYFKLARLLYRRAKLDARDS